MAMTHLGIRVRSLLKPLIFSVASAALCASPAHASSIVISALPFVTVGAVGDTVTIPILITGTTDVTSWQFDLNYDSSIVDATSVAEGSFMSSFGLTSFTPGFLLPGVVSGVADFYVDLLPDPSGDGVLADITFLARAPGVSPLTFSNVFLNLSGLGFTTQDGQICVEPAACTTTSPVPEPMTLTLLASGLALAAGRKAVKRQRP
jgi:hypothetical protein